MAISGVPRTQRLIDKISGLIDSRWDQWLQSIVRALDAAGIQVGAVSQTAPIAASVSTTALSTPLAAGFYQVVYALYVVTPASISSSLTFTAAWMLNGVSHSQSGVALTGNATTTQQNGVFTVAVDTQTQVTYSIAYVSSGTAMSYSYTVRLVALP